MSREIVKLHETFAGVEYSRASRDYSLIRTYGLSSDSGTAKLRVTVRIDTSTRSQSVYRAEVWNGSGWQEVVKILAEDPMTVDFRGLESEKSANLEYMAVELLNRATQIL